MDKIRVVLTGHRGKVGRILAPALEAAPEIEYLGGIGEGDDLVERLQQWSPQVVVDFTQPQAALPIALAAVAAGACPVVGTSGMGTDEVSRLEAVCQRAGVGGIVAPNFAVGAVAMMWLAERAAPLFEAAEIIEMHNPAKLDAPSGTALATAHRLSNAGISAPAIHSLRLPGVVAEQEVVFGTAGQTLRIAHQTTSREAFVPGVLLAIKEVVKSPKFWYGLDELLGIGSSDSSAARSNEGQQDA